MSEDQYLRAHQALIGTTELVTAYVGSDTSKAAVAMLDMLIAVYCMDLMNVTPADLLPKQAAIKQAMAIRNLLAGDSKEIPKI
mgnify:CR=1 FL=1